MWREARATAHKYNLDGAAHLDMFVGTNMPLPFPDALQEFKLVASSQEASNGGHSAAAVNSVTKSGTNEFHGDLFWFLRNAALNSRDAFAARTTNRSAINLEVVSAGQSRKTRYSFFSDSRTQQHARPRRMPRPMSPQR